MEEIVDRPPVETDVVTAVRNLLAGSAEPMTLVRIRAGLPAALRPAELATLADGLRRQVSANVLYVYPKYRGPHERYWDRPMQVHVASLVRVIVNAGPLSWSEIRRKLPEYARSHACSVLEDLLAGGVLHRHPPTKRRNGPRFGLHRPDPKLYLRPELERAFAHLETLGFVRAELRQGALEMLHEEEWSAVPAGNQP